MQALVSLHLAGSINELYIRTYSFIKKTDRCNVDNKWNAK